MSQNRACENLLLNFCGGWKNKILYILVFWLIKKGCAIMSTPKYKHFSFEKRCVIEELLNHNYNFTQDHCVKLKINEKTQVIDTCIIMFFNI